ncbi:MarR family winged helix-turn-helix transcriptional regulator [Nonomuraea typhae]|uniref:MarR family winged helix-turn-helix transcriptional regulator n=1 Tax=Nonomuraea typhae TaxID=2603600 RepID=UPI0012FB7395|nr:MarR family transcriptional regulator [Nonomuraea typhae]
MTIEMFERTLELAALLAAEIERKLAADGLTRSRAQVLRRLGEEGPMQQRELARVFDVSARNITGLVDGLVTTGFVTREPHPDDRRATLVTLTARGVTAAQTIEASRHELAEAMFAGIPEREKHAYRGVLDTLLDNLRTR